jgi:hypothetical protein
MPAHPRATSPASSCRVGTKHGRSQGPVGTAKVQDLRVTHRCSAASGEAPMKLTLSAAVALIFSLGVPVACGKSDQADPTATDWALCELNSDCILSPASCCAVCGKPALADVDAVNRERQDEHFRDICPDPGPCPKCAESPNPELSATCTNGACVALDIREHQTSVCSSNDDCRLRVTGCCECGGSTASWALIAIARDGEPSYQALVCDPDQACDECAPVYPTDVEAYCETHGHCAIRPATDCTMTCAAQGMSCCDGECVLLYNDVLNCGGCGNLCPEEAPYCDGNSCTPAPCDMAGACTGSELCCGSACCAPGELCCTVPGPGPSGLPGCYAPNDAGTCPIGCPLCQ